MHDYHTHTHTHTNTFIPPIFTNKLNQLHELFLVFYTLTRALDLLAWTNVCHFTLPFLHAHYPILTFYYLPLSPCLATSELYPRVDEHAKNVRLNKKKNKVHSQAARLSSSAASPMDSAPTSNFHSFQTDDDDEVSPCLLCLSLTL